MSTAVVQIYGQNHNIQYDFGLVAYYKFNNDVTDSYGLNDGVATNLTYQNRFNGQCGQFNNSHVVIPHNNDLSFTDGFIDKPFSIGFHINFDTNAGAQYIFNKVSSTDAGNLEWRVVLFGSRIYIYLDDNITNGRLTTSRDLQLFANTDYTVVITRGATGFPLIYVDGVNLSQTSTTTGVYNNMELTSSEVVIGARNFGKGSDMSGCIDDLFISNKELTQEEVTEVHARVSNGIELI